MGSRNSKDVSCSSFTLQSFTSVCGFDLWKVRTSIKKASESSCFFFPVFPFAIVTDFLTAKNTLACPERKDGLSKFLPPGVILSSSLTNVSGEKWIEQRPLVCVAISEVLKEAHVLASAKRNAALICQSLHEVYEENSKKNSADKKNDRDATNVHLEDVLQRGVFLWISDMVFGANLSLPSPFSASFLKTWRTMRAKVKQTSTTVPASSSSSSSFREASTDAFVPETIDLLVAQVRGEQKETSTDISLLHCLCRSSLSNQAVSSNCLSFLIAGFETTYEVIFLTLLMLGGKEHVELRKLVTQESCQYALFESNHSSSICSSSSCYETKKSKLAQAHSALHDIKKVAVMGECLKQLPSALLSAELLLPRCMLETLLKMPPVWTLSRCITASNHYPPSFTLFEASKCPRGIWVDVVTCNGVNESWPNWNPLEKLDENGYNACFGIGARYCPAGTAALLCAFTVLRVICAEFEIISRGKEHLQSAYLSPGLGLDGKQSVTLRKIVTASSISTASLTSPLLALPNSAPAFTHSLSSSVGTASPPIATSSTASSASMFRECLASETSCWVIFQGKVLDVESFVNHHPGGDSILRAFKGKDVTETMESHSASARAFAMTLIASPR